MITKSRLNQLLLPALVLIGLIMGCGGKTSPEKKPPKGEGNISAKPKNEEVTVEPNPKGIDGGPSIGVGPAGEPANSNHPSFIAHTWKSDPFMSKGVEQSVTFSKTGALIITPDKDRPIKGRWEVADTRITLTYPDPATGKEQSLAYRFSLGGSHSAVRRRRVTGGKRSKKRICS